MMFMIVLRAFVVFGAVCMDLFVLVVLTCNSVVWVDLLDLLLLECLLTCFRF